jgi:hypothetical protein
MYILLTLNDLTADLEFKCRTLLDVFLLQMFARNCLNAAEQAGTNADETQRASDILFV